MTSKIQSFQIAGDSMYVLCEDGSIWFSTVITHDTQSSLSNWTCLHAAS